MLDPLRDLEAQLLDPLLELDQGRDFEAQLLDPLLGLGRHTRRFESQLLGESMGDQSMELEFPIVNDQ